MLIKTVDIIITTNSAGQTVESLPVREVADGETDIIGLPVDVIPVTEDPAGVPVRFVTGKAVQNSIGQWVDTVPVRGGVVYEAEATALFARMTVQPDTVLKGHINKMIKDLKASPAWGRLRGLYVKAVHDAQASRRNWISDDFNLTPVSSPTFTPYRGYAGDGAASYLNTGFAPGSDPLLLQDDASVFCWALSPMTARHGSFDGTRDFQIRSDASTNLRNIINSANNAIGNVTIPTNVGYLGNDRRDGTSVHAFSAGQNRGSVAINSVGRSTRPLYIGAWNANGTAANFNSVQIAAFGFGAGLGDAGHLALYNALNTYLQAVGAVT